MLQVFIREQFKFERNHLIIHGCKKLKAKHPLTYMTMKIKYLCILFHKVKNDEFISISDTISISSSFSPREASEESTDPCSYKVQSAPATSYARISPYSSSNYPKSLPPPH